MIEIYPSQRLASVPPLQTGEVHLWKIEIPGVRTEIDTASCLNPAEHHRFRQYRREQDAHRFASRRSALRCILGRYLGCAPSEIAFAAQDVAGKPMLAHPHQDRLVFNASSSADIALIAVSLDGALGVDVEAMRPFEDKDEIAERFFAPNETARWRALPPKHRSDAFYRLWTSKEALLKAVGTGLPGGLDRFEVSTEPARPPALLRDTEGSSRLQLYAADPDAGYSAALAIDEPDVNVLRFLFDPRDAQ